MRGKEKIWTFKFSVQFVEFLPSLLYFYFFMIVFFSFVCVSLKILLCYFTFIVVNYEATLREQKAIEIETKFLMDIKQLRIGIKQELRLLRSQGYKWVHRDTHTYTHTHVLIIHIHIWHRHIIYVLSFCVLFRFLFFLYFFRTFRDRQCFIIVVV